jgi:hypothetical protein
MSTDQHKEISAAIEGLRSRLDTLASITADNISYCCKRTSDAGMRDIPIPASKLCLRNCSLTQLFATSGA